MKELKGNSIAVGLAAGRAVIVDKRLLEIPQHKISKKDLDKETEAYLNAYAESEAEIKEYIALHDLHENEKDIINTHLDILADPDIRENILTLISEKTHNVAKAIHLAFEQAIMFFKSMENEMFAQRANDFEDVRNRLLRKVLKIEDDPFNRLGHETIPIFQEIQPSEVSQLSKLGVSAYLCDNCSYTSHAAILSRALNIACIADIEGIRNYIHEDDHLIVDGETGIVIHDPDEEALEYYAQKLQIQELILNKQRVLLDQPTVTQNGRSISLALNIGLPEEISKVTELNADGVGLFRTEFLFLSRNDLPSEEEQYEIYRNLAQEIAPKVLTIRTFDLGGDKLSHLIPSSKENNPYLGNRGIRFSLAHPEVLKTQLRAILRASVHNNIRIMFPMIIDVDDFLEAKRVFKQCADSLYEDGIAYDYDIQVGTMVEIPSAALSSEALAKESDFLSIGTNDLVQYTLAVDRNNDMVSRYYIQHHPAVLKLIRATVVNAAVHNRDISVCGEMASIPEYAPLLIGMGINDLSINPSSYFDIKKVVLLCDAELEKIISGFDFSTSLPQVDDLVYRRLKPYYAIKGGR